MFQAVLVPMLILNVACGLSPILKSVQDRRDLELIMIDLMNRLVLDHDVTCVAIICDAVYLNVFDGHFFRNTYAVPIVMIVVEDYEDLLSPNFDTLESLREARKDGCNVYTILLANGYQTARLLRFGDRHRMLDTRAKFIILHDYRLFHSKLHYLWKRIINVIFLRYHRKISGVLRSKEWFDLSTVPYPNPIKDIFISKRVDIWKNGKYHYNNTLFYDKTKNLHSKLLNVVYLDHAPSVIVTKANESNKVGGVEIEILHTLAKKMNFKPKLYEPINADLFKWGHKQANGSFSGLLGEMVNGKADVALGNLQYNPYHLEMTDLSIPYTSQCFTFVTPEALFDNSWKTLILPFKLQMWIAVLLVLLITGTIFNGLARYHMSLQEYKKCQVLNKNMKPLQKLEIPESNESRPVGLFLFGEIINSILYTYGMLLMISLPKLPTGWSLRLLTGWYWIYCLLLVVSYRASMTAILANPAPRVTIDTLQELVNSKITCGGWGSETKRFFEKSSDEIQTIGQNFEVINNPFEAANKVAQGIYAYYDNQDFLKYITVRRKKANINSNYSNDMNTTDMAVNIGEERSLHIMSDCVVNTPISIGFHKNSPLKPLADVYLRHIVEVGLVEKWLNDAMHPIKTQETNEIETKALMNLKKLYGAFVALAIGYFLSVFCLVGEVIHWKCFVEKDPKFDKYALDIYYMHKNKKQ